MMGSFSMKKKEEEKEENTSKFSVDKILGKRPTASTSNWSGMNAFMNKKPKVDESKIKEEKDVKFCKKCNKKTEYICKCKECDNIVD